MAETCFVREKGYIEQHKINVMSWYLQNRLFRPTLKHTGYLNLEIFLKLEKTYKFGATCPKVRPENNRRLPIAFGPSRESPCLEASPKIYQRTTAFETLSTLEYIPRSSTFHFRLLKGELPVSKTTILRAPFFAQMILQYTENAILKLSIWKRQDES